MLIKKNTIFLLGGKDLEMVEIKRVLETHKIKYYDENLSWGAKLSDYTHKLNKLTTYYAVELDIDISDYDNIHIIDHHGTTHNHKESSLLQILKLLNIIPTRDQQLIAANDARYIKGMKCLDATDAEIALIRKRDKEAQGISEKDEYKGREDVKLREVKNDISIVSTSLSSFTPISDALYFNVAVEKRTDKSIIYNDTKIVFYGFRLDIMQTLCKAEDIDENAYYFGGGEQGYFGIKEKILNSNSGLKFKMRGLNAGSGVEKCGVNAESGVENTRLKFEIRGQALKIHPLIIKILSSLALSANVWL